MFETIRKKWKEAKGFTLVELIVVLVILAILAAMLVPALTGYIDRANKEKITAETRQVVMAAQTIASEEYAKGTADSAIESSITKENSSSAANDVMKLAEVESSGTITNVEVQDGKVEKLTWENGKSCTYVADGTGADGVYTVNPS